MKVQSISINRRDSTEEGLKLGDATFYKRDESMEARITLSECTPGAIEAIGRLRNYKLTSSISPRCLRRSPWRA